MAYFSHGEGRLKLMLLYFLNEIDLELSKNQLYTIFAEQNWMEFFDFQTALLQLEEDALVAALPCPFGQGYRVTPQGQSTLALFSSELPHSIQEKLSLFAKQNRELLKSCSQFSCTQTQLPDGGWLVVLRLMDKTTRIMDISLQLPSAQLATEASENWPEQAGAIYQELIRRLFREA